MRQLLVHIGTHKTGTTSIQALLFRAAAKLKRSGTTIPHAGRPTRGLAGHHNIGWFLRGDPRANPKWGTLDDLATELSSIRTPRAVISSEDFEYLVNYPHLLRQFEERIRAIGWEPTYLLFLREPASYAISLYNELLKSGLSGSFDSFAESVLRDGRFRMLGDWTYYFDYDAFVREWREAARGPLSIHSYEHACAGDGVIETFFSLIGVPPHLADMRGGSVRIGGLEKLAMKLGLASGYVEGPNPAQLNISAAPVTPEMRDLAKPIGEAFGPAYARLTAVPAG